MMYVVVALLVVLVIEVAILIQRVGRNDGLPWPPFSAFLDGADLPKISEAKTLAQQLDYAGCAAAYTLMLARRDRSSGHPS